MYDVITIGDGTNDIFLKPHEASLIDSPECPERGVCDRSLICWNFGEKITVDKVYYDVGGSACNVAVGLSRLGLKTALICALGSDSVGEKVKKKLAKEKIPQQYLKILKNIETSFSVIINYQGERTILVYHGLRDYSRLTIPRSIRTKWLYLGPLGKNYQSLYQQAISLASEKNISLALNPGVIQIKDKDILLKSILRVTKILFLNREETIDLLKIPGLPRTKDLLVKLKSLGPEVVVITDGKNGAYATEGINYFHLPAGHAQKIDSTGAGDAFSAGFLASYFKEENISEALRWGIINSTAVIEEIGAQTGLLRLGQLQKDLLASPAIYKL